MGIGGVVGALGLEGRASGDAPTVGVSCRNWGGQNSGDSLLN